MSGEQMRLAVEFDPEFQENHNLTTWEIITNQNYVLVDGLNFNRHILLLIPGTEFTVKDKKLIFTNADKTFIRLCDGVIKVSDQTGKVLWPNP